MSLANKAIVLRVFESMNKHDVSAIAELYPNCVYRSPAIGELRGEAYRQYMTSAFTAFPDAHWTMEDQLADGDKVVTRWSFTGTHQGTFLGIAPTGKKVKFSGIVIDHIVAGKITEEWEELDSLGMMQQLGVVAPISLLEPKFAAAHT